MVLRHRIEDLLYLYLPYAAISTAFYMTDIFKRVFTLLRSP